MSLQPHGELDCPFPLRTHQLEALDAFERARVQGSTRWWVTMPPGAGKTLVGTEVARRLDRRTVVFCPNTAIQGQWLRTWDLYDGPPAGRHRDLRTPFTVLSYQSLAVFDDDATDPGESGGQVGRLHANGLALIERLRGAGPLTLVLDECHHLLEVWGELLREVLVQLPDAVVLGLTATPPGSMTRSQGELAAELFGPILYEARIPALVKEGTLAPYAELAWLVEPTPEESGWLREQDTRFRELTTDLFAPDFGSTPLPVWLTDRFVTPCEQGSSTWAELSGAAPELGDAVLRLAHDGLVALPAGAVLREQHRRAPSAADWVLVLDDWLSNCVVPRARGESEPDRRVLEVVRRTLPSIGYVWTKRGVRAGRGIVDRVTARSAAKQDAVVDIAAAEHRCLGEAARVLVLCDHERATATSTRRIADGEAAPPQPAGSATGVLAALLQDPGTAPLAPMLVTGRTVAGSVETLETLIAFVDQVRPGLAGSLTVDDSGEVPVLTGRWGPAEWVEQVTAFHAAGGTRALVGTRALLGEGWDAPWVTTLIDLTTATTPTSVVQTRGRALRRDPGDPRKVALIWTVVAVAEGHPAGGGDWERFVRKHQGYFTVDEQGVVVDGVAGVDSSFSAYAPPPLADLPAVDARMLVRAEDRDAVRDQWLRTPAYDDRVRHVVRVRSDRVPAPPGETDGTVGLVPWAVRSRLHPHGWTAAVPALLALVLVALALTGALPAVVDLLAPPALVLAAALWGRSRLVAASRHVASLGLVAAAVADGLKGAGLAAVGAESLRTEVLADGTLSFSLDGEETASEVFAASLEEAVAPMASPRYVLPRWTTSPPRGVDGLVRGLRSVVRPQPDGEVWHTVPSALAATRARADAYADAWGYWLGGGAAVYAGSPEGAGVLAAHRGLDPFGVTSVLRRVWH